jgi:hypothetical protein
MGREELTKANVYLDYLRDIAFTMVTRIMHWGTKLIMPGIPFIRLLEIKSLNLFSY